MTHSAEISDAADLRLAPKGAKRCISEAARAKYTELTCYRWDTDDADRRIIANRFARFIQDVSDAAKEGVRQLRIPHAQHIDCFAAADRLAPFILPDPVDPAEQLATELFDNGYKFHAESIRQALAKRGLEIREMQS